MSPADMSGMIGGDADFTGVNFKEAQISKQAYEICSIRANTKMSCNTHRAFARNGKFVGCDFTNAIVDRQEVKFMNIDMFFIYLYMCMYMYVCINKQ